MSAPVRGRGFFAGAVRRPIALLVFFVTLLVVGGIAYVRIPLELIPAGIESDGLQIYINHPGASAQENERKVVRVLEEQIRTLQGVEHTYSRSNEDDAWIEVVYAQGEDMRLAKAELRDRIERARPLLPDTVDRIFVWSWDNSELPLMFFALLHEGDSERTDYLVDTVVQRHLESVDGVTRVQVWGMLDDSVRIELDEEKVKAARLDIGQLIRRLRQDNFTEPLGEVYDGGRRLLLRTDMRFKSLEEIERYPIGGGLVLADVGEVIMAKSVRDRLSRIDGQFAYYGEIRRESGANIVETTHKVRAALEELEQDPELSGHFRFVVFFAQGDLIESALDQLGETAVWGGALAALVLLLFLRRVRVTLCVALSIPVSALLSIAWVHFTGGTFNILTMAGITLAIGMLVDNSVVVIENIARLHAEGHTPRQAAAEGARDVGLAVALATMTSVVVFLPLIFMSGNPTIRVMFGALGLPLCVALLFSLMVALVFLPVVTAHIVGPRGRVMSAVARGIAPVAALPVRGLLVVLELGRRAGGAALFLVHKLERALLAVLAPLRWPLALGLLGLAAWRWRETARAVGLLDPLAEAGLAPASVAGGAPAIATALVAPAALLAAALCVFGLKRWRARPAAPPAARPSGLQGVRSFVDLLALSNQRLLDWTLRHRLLATGLAAGAVATVAVPMANMTMTSFGEDESRSRIEINVDLEDNFTLAEAGDELALYEVVLEEHKDELSFEHMSCRFGRRGGHITLYWDDSQPPDRFAGVRKRVRALLPEVPGHEVRLYGDEPLDTKSRSMVVYQLVGPDPDVLAELGEQAVAVLETVPGLEDVSSPLDEAPEQVHVALDGEQAWQLGVTADIALQNIAWVLRGAMLPRYQETGREIPFLIEYDEETAAGLDTLKDLDVFTMKGTTALASFARLEFSQGPRTIFRRDGQISYALQARVQDPTRQLELSDAGFEALQQLDMPRGFAIARDDLISTRQEAELEELQRALLLSIVLVFLLMGILFESVLLPFSVLFTIPYAVVGALWTLFLTGTTMDSVGWIGIIILVGVVVNNGIVLIDRIHRLRGEGLARTRAVLEGSASRVRPIVMTAMTTVFGLLPMALSEPPAEGIDYRALATCVAGGLTFSTFFTLWVVPLAYTIVDDFGRIVSARMRWTLGRFGARGARRALAAEAGVEGA